MVMPSYTEEYKRIQEQFHIQRPDYGTSSSRWCDHIAGIAKQLNTRDILDFGCGKAHLQKGLPYPIQNYDPFIPEHSKYPNPAAIVVCTDLLEHVEPTCLDAVLDELRALTIDMLFLNVATRPASKFLPDGRNAHLIQEKPNWWLEKLLPRFELTSFQVGRGEFTAIMTLPEDAE